VQRHHRLLNHYSLGVTETNEPTSTPTPAENLPPAYDAASVPAQAPPPPAPAYGGAPGVVATGQLGKVRGTGTCILLTIVTLGIYSLFWYFKTHDEMKQHSGTGIGGALALILALFVGFVMPFVASNEVGGLYERRGQAKPVSAVTGLWILLPLVGGIVWFVKTNGALNDYWRSLGAEG
jgi:hypothetical protein